MFEIKYGIHRGTLTSRDVGEPKNFGTRDEAISWFKDEQAWLRSIGYVFWYCHLFDENGSMETLEQNSYPVV